LHQRIAKLLGTSPQGYRRVIGGYTPAARWICATEAHTYFIKAATTPLTAEFLRREIRSYTLIRGDFMPEVIAWEDHETQPILMLEDLSQHCWPPPWTDGHVKAVLDCIREMHRAAAPPDSFAEAHGVGKLGWLEVARDPQPFLALGIASVDWLERALPQLIQLEAQCPTEGDALTHGDIRSDNLCIRDSRAILIDWNLACRSNPRLDLGFWLPSLASEGGPEPEALLPDAPEVAARVAGFFACRAGLPDIPDAPRVRLVQRQQLQYALPWAARALDLPMPQNGPAG
jgi:thiamine kinase-like enzyme